MINQYQTFLSEKKRLSSDTWFFRFKLINPPEINFKAGQYLILKINNQPRLFSILSPSYIKNEVDFLIKIIPHGLASDYLIQLPVGKQIKLEGPAGVFELKENNKDKIFLVTSTGLAPIYSMIKSYFHQAKFSSLAQTKPPKFYLFWGLKNYQDIYFFDQLKELITINRYQLAVFICLSRQQTLANIPKTDRSFFHLGHVNNVWESFINQSYKQSSNQSIKQFLNQFDYYLCGSRVVVESLKKFLSVKEIEKENILFEKF